MTRITNFITSHDRLLTILIALLSLIGLAQLDVSLGQRLGMYASFALLVFSGLFGITVVHLAKFAALLVRRD